VPKEVITRAKEILRNLEKGEFDEIGMPRIVRGTREGKNTSPQLSLFTRKESAMARENKNEEIVTELKTLDIHSMSPLEALNKLSELKNKISE
jgi:DNA mismatch repair protein MutS